MLFIIHSVVEFDTYLIVWFVEENCLPTVQTSDNIQKTSALCHTQQTLTSSANSNRVELGQHDIQHHLRPWTSMMRANKYMRMKIWVPWRFTEHDNWMTTVAPGCWHKQKLQSSMLARCEMCVCVSESFNNLIFHMKIAGSWQTDRKFIHSRRGDNSDPLKISMRKWKTTGKGGKIKSEKKMYLNSFIS